MEAAVRWSPFSTSDRRRFLLVDVADSSLALNEVDSVDGRRIEYHKVAQHGKLQNFSAFDWSKTDESIVALGFVSGNAGIVKLNEGGVPSETLATIRIKQQRKCNSISLSSENWMAVALDKTRSDVCLNVYDIGRDASSFNDPIRRLCPDALVSSARFLPDQPQEIVLSANRSFIRVYDLRGGNRVYSAHTQATDLRRFQCKRNAKSASYNEELQQHHH
jgi:WD40 repeat protein